MVVLVVYKNEEGKALEWQQHVPNNNHMGATYCNGDPEFCSDLALSLMKSFPYPRQNLNATDPLYGPEGRTRGSRPNPIVQNERELTPVTDCVAAPVDKPV